MRTIVVTALIAALALAAFCIWRGLPSSRPPPAPPPPAPAPPPRVTITFAGDIMLAGGVGRLAAARGVEHLFSGVSEIILRDDLTVANLECAAAHSGAPAKDKQFTFRADPALLPGLRRAGIEAVSLANNHSLDYGRQALVETMQHLRRAGIAFAGAGEDLDAAAAPVMIEVAGHRVALLAATRVVPDVTWYVGADRAGVATAYDPTRLLAEIRRARPQADVVVAYLHWGEEGARFPQASQRQLGRACIEAGADLVVASHPHVLQGFEFHRGRLIAYSLGNFVFSSSDRVTALLQVTFRGGALEQARVIPCRIVSYCPQVMADDEQRARGLRALEAQSFGVRIGQDGGLREASGGAD